MGEKILKTEQAIINRFQELRQELSVLSGRANELASESHEHDLVLKALEPMDGDRKCYRVVGEILVERTVAEVKPAVKGNKEQLDAVVERLLKQLEVKKKDLSDFQERYKIRIKGEDELPMQQKEKSTSQGILA
ncbi:hypothetical protein COCSUDRAFT_83446 [Coccomyxa subellipsoidea C-169]|uniref:Prefoldin beta-like protein n=1 Tax=Coccomyxa subellipsoidea (strain C-169) TaxID=574566 RepID=I0ZB07_COCSC|nr:hypothetical protein COCSUDRAFT_83446 [Coccomyxa subellipsoidea C-169]EIE27826.1 hypothetical protein COCSUDRAFT_83446 [Coccomyxa subellipsoidea C-169]|eukprot:XP_005652370.1 hypothetical protein COCSUDRAFT_83446 [Coccomyxa subellipsoidea C-169]